MSYKYACQCVVYTNRRDAHAEVVLAGYASRVRGSPRLLSRTLIALDSLTVSSVCLAPCQYTK